MSPARLGDAIQTLEESDRKAWSYEETHFVEGALRLIRVKDLLPLSGRVASIALLQWSGINPSQKDDEFPKYAAISHCWISSPEVQRLSSFANRPLTIDTGHSTAHLISWHGLCQAAKAARHLGCDYLWLDLVCLHQGSARDKALQIANMGHIYKNAEAVLVMAGGVAAAQGAEHRASWITRAWTLQEATLCANTYALHIWPVPDPRYKYQQQALKMPAFLDIQHIDGDLAISPLTDLMQCSTGHQIYRTEIATGDKTIENIVIRCFGDQEVMMTSLIAVRDGETSEMKRSAAWRSMWLRTSSKPQDMIFSMMHVLGVTLEVDYSRTREDLVLELAQKSRSPPSWLDMGSKLPFDARYGLLPVLPSFEPHCAPAYRIDGETVAVETRLSYLHYISDFCIRVLTPAITNSSHNGDVVCAPLYEVYRGSSAKAFVSNDLGEKAECRTDLIGSYIMILGRLKAYFDHTITWTGPATCIIRKSEAGVWERRSDVYHLIPFSFMESAKPRHVRIGGSPGAAITACDCDIEPTRSSAAAEPN